MKRFIKIPLIIIIAVALLACFVWLVSGPDEQAAASGSDTSRGPSFAVHVEKPRLARFLFGILPTRLEEKVFGGYELRFDHNSRGAAIGRVGHNRLELRADGWDFLIETDGEGVVAPGTRLVFPLELGGRQVTLRCRPADRGIGQLHITSRAGADAFGGSFLVELASCENAKSGKAIEWPPAPLTVRGSFDGLPHGSP